MIYSLCVMTSPTSCWGVVVTYVDDLLYLGAEGVIKALHEFVELEWLTSLLEWINEVTPVRYLGVENLQDSLATT